MLGNLKVLKYLIINKKAKVPKFCFVRQAYNESPRKELTITEFLKEQEYEFNSENYKRRNIELFK